MRYYFALWDQPLVITSRAQRRKKKKRKNKLKPSDDIKEKKDSRPSTVPNFAQNFLRLHLKQTKEKV